MRVPAADMQAIATHEGDVRARYAGCLLLTVIVAVGMRRIPGMKESIWEYLFVNAVQSAIDHDSMAQLG